MKMVSDKHDQIMKKINSPEKKRRNIKPTAQEKAIEFIEREACSQSIQEDFFLAKDKLDLEYKINKTNKDLYALAEQILKIAMQQEEITDLLTHSWSYRIRKWFGF